MEIEKQYTILREKFPEFKKDWLTTQKLEFGPECFALGFTTKETNDMVGKFQGFKSPNMLVIISEAQAVEPIVYRQLKGLMTSSNSRVLEIGNPIFPYGDFFQHCTQTHYGYHVIKMSCYDSPNVIAGKEVIRGMVCKEYIDGFISELGQDYMEDPEFQARVLGEFPQQSVLAWIPLQKIIQAIDRKLPGSDHLKVGGLDVAGTGQDETVHCVLEGGRQIRQDIFKRTLTEETVGWARDIIQQEKLEALAIDYGYDPGVTNWLNYEKMPVTPVNFGAKSPDDRFENLATYMWYLLRCAFMDGTISILDDPVLVAQLAGRLVEPTPKGKKRLVSKKKNMKDSPDRADALVLAWYARISILGGKDIVADLGQSDADRLQEVLERVTNRQDVVVSTESENEIGTADNEASQLEF